MQRAGEMLHINVLGLASISQDVTPELARATIASVSVLGRIACQSGGQGRSCRQDTVKAMLNQDIIREATRLTRAGQLIEATALLQRMLRGEAGASRAIVPAVASLLQDGPLTIDAKANRVEKTDVLRNQSQRPPLNRACSGRYWIAKGRSRDRTAR